MSRWHPDTLERKLSWIYVDINNFRPLFSASRHRRCINVVAHNVLICNAVLAKSRNRSCNQ